MEEYLSMFAVIDRETESEIDVLGQQLQRFSCGEKKAESKGKALNLLVHLNLSAEY